ncbi:hypothetical protein [Thermococcus sp.]|uniref:hypothetical protein n=1 Tax=Thermococcus sp. TaxID=35749 RepID=UPI0026379FD3|nr:hypothetical protein [Thermococcus sp.]
MDELKEMERTYRRLFGLGSLLLLTGFVLLIFRPIGNETSVVAGLIVFLLSFIPLDMARRTARKMAVVALRGK